MNAHPIRLACAALCAGALSLAASAIHAAPDDLPSALTTPLRAVAEDGRRVLLMPDGRWHLDKQAGNAAATPRADAVTSPYRTAVKRFSVKYDTRNWIPLPVKEGEEGKRSFKHRTLPVQAMVIADEVPANNTVLRNIILHNMRNAGAAVTVLIDEERDRGKDKIGYIRLLGSMQGMDYVFTTNYFANSDGNVQVTCLTVQALFAKSQAECQQFIDGLTIDGLTID